MKRVLAAVLAALFLFLLFPAGGLAATESGVEVTIKTASPLEVFVDEKFAIELQVENTKEEPLSVELGGEIDAGAVNTKVSIAAKTVNLEPQEVRIVFLEGVAKAAGVYSFRVKIGAEVVGDELLIKVSKKDSTAPVDPSPRPQPEPLFSVTGVTFSPSRPNPEHSFTANISFKNFNYTAAHNVVVTLDGGENFTVMDLTNKVSFANVSGDSAYVASYKIRAKPGRASNHVQVSFAYQYDDSQGVSTETLNLPLGTAPGEAPPAQPFLKIGTFTVESEAEPEGDRGDFRLRFLLQNLGAGRAESVRLKFEGEQAFLRQSSNVIFISELAAGENTGLVAEMSVSSEDSAFYSIPISLSYLSDAGEEYSSQESLTISAADLGLAEPDPVTGTPRVMLGKYILSESQVLAGNTIKLVLHIENSSPVEVRNLKISLGVIQVSGETGGIVFSPVNSSNSFYVESIGPRKIYVREIEIYVDPNAAAKTYIVPVEIEYEDSSGQSYNVEEMVNIPVIQESRLQVLSVDVPPMASVGEPLPVTAEFVNVGKVALKNFLISIEGDFQKENATYFLASLEMGISDYFMGMIFPREEGLLTGSVVFTYTDNTNKEVKIEEPFEVNVQMAMEHPGEFPGEEFPPDFSPEGNTPLMGRLLKWLVPLLVLVVAVLVVIKRRRAKRGELFDDAL